MKEKTIKIEDSDSFQMIFTKYGALALDKQESLADIIGDNLGSLNIEEGTLSFGDELKFPIQIIGIFSEENKKWHWAWDNEGIDLPEKLVKEAAEVKKIGEKHNITQFTTNTFDADNLESHIIAMTVSGIMDDSAYYAAEFDGITFFVTIKSDEIPRNDTIERFVEVYTKFHKDFDVNAKLAFEGYTILRGYQYKEKDEFSVAKIGQSRVIVGFTERGNVNLIKPLIE